MAVSSSSAASAAGLEVGVNDATTEVGEGRATDTRLECKVVPKAAGAVHSQAQTLSAARTRWRRGPVVASWCEMPMFMDRVVLADEILALILRTEFAHEGISFLTPEDFSQQLAYMKRPKGYQIDPHVHNLVPRNIDWTQEVLFIKSGRVRVDFYSQDRVYLESRILNKGDVILLAHGGHGFTMLEESEIIEVKQGPYAGDQDKVRFSGITEDKVLSFK